MSHYGAIYIARLVKDGREVFKVGQTRSSVAERLAALRADSTTSNQYEEVGHIVVSDVDRAASACHSRLRSHRRKRTDLGGTAELALLLSLVRRGCRPFAIADNLPEVDAPPNGHDVDRIFDQTVARIETEERRSMHRIDETMRAAQKAVSCLAEACSELSLKLADRRDRIEFQIRAHVDRRALECSEGYHHVVCRAVLRAPVRVPARTNGVEYKMIRFRPLPPLAPGDQREQPHADDDGAYAVIELGVEISMQQVLRFTIIPSSIELRGGDSRGLMSRRLLAPLNTRACLPDAETAKTIFVQLLAVNTYRMPDAVERGYYEDREGRNRGKGYYGVSLARYYSSGRIRYRENWVNQADCNLDTSMLAPFVPEGDAGGSPAD